MPAFDFPPAPFVGQTFTPPGSDLIYVWTGVTWNSTIATGSGTVTQIDTGVGLEGGPITTTGTISMTDTAVVPGSYNAANITIDQQGRITAAAQGQSSGVLIQDTPPVGPITGNLWWDSSTDNSGGRLYVYYTDENSAQWVNTNPSGGDAGGGGNSSVSVLPSAPSTPEQGDLWFCTSDGRLYVFYDDGDTFQWVDASPDSLESVVNSGANWPATAAENDLFFRTTDGRLYIYYKDTDGMQWVDASPDAPPSEYWTRNDATDTITTLEPGDKLEIGGQIITDKWFESNRTSGTDSCFFGKLSGTETVNIRSEGSASFSSSIGIGGPVNIDASQMNIALNSDGSASFGDSATFAGNVSVGDAVNSSGALIAAGGNNIWYGYNQNTTTSSISKEGKGTFNDSVVAPNTCTAWVNFAGANGVVRESFNINGPVNRLDAGRWRVTFATPMDTGDYCIQVSSNQLTTIIDSQNSDYFEMSVFDGGGSRVDTTIVCATVYGGKN